MDIQIKQLNKYFDHFHAVKNIDLAINSGVLVALLGPSGCGKTTLLRLIAGLESADQGTILFDGIEVTHKPARMRQIGFMFQHYALFRHMTVFENIAFGLRMVPRKLRLSNTAISDKVHQLLKLVQLDWLVNAYPQQLSGGQRQRIALARALATEPKLLLLDEPFGALDAKVRKELRQWLKQLQRTLGITSILVTHDQEEALEIADQVVIMNQGQIEQSGCAEVLYHQPQNIFVTEFLGEANVFEDACIEKGQLHVGHYAEPISPPTVLRQQVRVYVRPEEIKLFTSARTNTIDGAKIKSIQIVGAQIRVQLERQQTNSLVQVLLSASEYRQLLLVIGQKVWFSPERLMVFQLPEMVEYVI